MIHAFGFFPTPYVRMLNTHTHMYIDSHRQFLIRCVGQRNAPQLHHVCSTCYCRLTSEPPCSGSVGCVCVLRASSAMHDNNLCSALQCRTDQTGAAKRKRTLRSFQRSCCRRWRRRTALRMSPPSMLSSVPGRVLVHWMFSSSNSSSRRSRPG